MMWGQRVRHGLVDVAADGRRNPDVLDRRGPGGPRPAPRPGIGRGGGMDRPDPLMLLANPLARGEVSVEEYEQRRRLIVDGH